MKQPRCPISQSGCTARPAKWQGNVRHSHTVRNAVSASDKDPYDSSSEIVGVDPCSHSGAAASLLAGSSAALLISSMLCHSHPFVLDVRPLRHLPGRFTYSVGRDGETRVFSLHTYSNLEEARRAGEAALRAWTANWERCALNQHSA